MKRNEPCHCGSGVKYKKCCQRKERRTLPKGTQLIILALLPLALGGVVWTLIHGTGDEEPEPSRFSSGTTVPAQPASPIGVPGPQPDGPVPEGKVWSEEHGHWHDASPVQVENSGDGSLAATLGGAQPGNPPQDGEVRNGKVWDAEHGHWHDASGEQIESSAENDLAAVGDAQTTDAPQDGEVRDGRVWSAEHGHWHNAGSTPSVPRSQSPRVTVGEDGRVSTSRPIPQPPGPVPAGKVWSPEHGHWHDKPTFPSEEPNDDEPEQN